MPKNARQQIIQAERTKNERWFISRWKQIGGQIYEREWRFHPDRKWRFDFAFPKIKVAVEIDSAAHKIYWNSYTRDVEKMNEALLMGWQVFRVTGQMIKKDDIEFLERLKEYVNENRG